MHFYTTGQWVLLFFFYCFCGWVWESCYVSLCQRHWTNRGFLNGPILPIYGSGAILILFVTLPVAENPWLVWLFGMLAATALEYVTGAAMERIFKVRYWDYSKKPCNLHGYICLTSSVAWGFFSLLLVDLLHPPVGRLISRIPDFLVDPAALVLTALFSADVVRSVQAALDLKEVLTKLTEENEELRRLARRAEVAAAFAENDLRTFRERTALDRLALRARLQEDLNEHREVVEERFNRRRGRLEDSLRRRTQAKLDILSEISQALEQSLDRLSSQGLEPEALKERRQELLEVLQRVSDRAHTVRERSARTYQRSLRLLRAHPSAIARDFAEALQSLRDLDDERK